MSDGNCFQAAAEALLEMAQTADLIGAELVHGTVVGTGPPVEGVRYGHAWVELFGGRMVHDCSNGREVVCPRRVYYELGQAQPVHRYPLAEARRLILEHEHWGPWGDLGVDQ